MLPSISTDMVKMGACTGPVWDTSLYWSPGLSWFSFISAFMACGGSSFSSARGKTNTQSLRVFGSSFKEAKLIPDQYFPVWAGSNWYFLVSGQS